MKYLIDDTLIYRPEDGVLIYSGNEDELVTLTATANSILSLLVSRHGVAIERDTFLSEVWDARGLRGSNSSLNQYISMLRKTLAGFAPHTPFIITVPKIGFMLNPDLPVVKQDDDIIAETTSAQATPPSTHNQWRWIWIMMLVFATALNFAFGPGHVSHGHGGALAQTWPLTTIDNCPVFTLRELPEAWRDEAKKLAKKVAEETAMPCQKNTVFYLHVQDNIFFGEGGRLVLSRCARSGGKAASCQTQYYYQW